jgi:hypothetical protein
MRLEDRVRPSANQASPAPASPYDDNRLAESVAASCGGTRSAVLAATLAKLAVDPASYEASVRGGKHCPLRAGRMMIERAADELLAAVAAAVDVTLPADAAHWVERARHEGLPLIVGWDLRGRSSRRCVKLYVNASDAGQAVRARLLKTLVTEAAGDHLPAVLGMNMGADGQVETKLYEQAADTQGLAQRCGERALVLARAASQEGADAGGVIAFDVHEGTLRPRAFFVALRDPPGATLWRCVESLPGYDAHAIAALLPFAPAPPRSVGISLHDETWTLYCKPNGSGHAPEALEPVAIFRADGVEVGVFVEPTERAARAFRRTDRHAISVREREGAPEPQAIESLVDWFASRLRGAERDGVPIVTRLDDPPSPWRMVAGDRP